MRKDLLDEILWFHLLPSEEYWSTPTYENTNVSLEDTLTDEEWRFLGKWWRRKGAIDTPNSVVTPGNRLT
jgi:hypothetical protein